MSDAPESIRPGHHEGSRYNGLHHQATAELSRPKHRAPARYANEVSETERLNRQELARATQAAAPAQAAIARPAGEARPAAGQPARPVQAGVEVVSAPASANRYDVAANCARGFSLDLGLFRIGEQHPDKRCLASTTSAINADRQAQEAQADHDQMRYAQQRRGNPNAGRVAAEANTDAVHQAQWSQYNHLVHTYVDSGADPGAAAAKARAALGWNRAAGDAQPVAYRPGFNETAHRYPAHATTAQLNDIEAARAHQIVTARFGADGWREAPATGTVVTQPGDVFAVSPGTTAIVREGATVMARNGASMFIQGGHGVFAWGSSGVVSGGEVEIYPGAHVRIVGQAKVIYKGQA